MVDKVFFFFYFVVLLYAAASWVYFLTIQLKIVFFFIKIYALSITREHLCNVKFNKTFYQKYEYERTAHQL